MPGRSEAQCALFCVRDEAARKPRGLVPLSTRPRGRFSPIRFNDALDLLSNVCGNGTRRAQIVQPERITFSLSVGNERAAVYNTNTRELAIELVMPQ